MSPAPRRAGPRGRERGSGGHPRELREYPPTGGAKSGTPPGAPEASERALGRLRGVADALGIGLTSDQGNRLLGYLGLLQRWNAVYNLTAVREPEAMLDLHLADCLAIVPSLRRFAAERSVEVLDVGTGAGLPGVVLAVMQPGWSVTCIDAVAKKATFVRQAATELGLQNLEARHGRVEDMSSDGRFDLVVARAFASLRDLAATTERLLAPDGAWAAMKAEVDERERIDVPQGIVFHVEPISVPGLAVRRCLVWMRRRRD